MDPLELFDRNTPWFHVKLPIRAATLQELSSSSISKVEIDELYQQAQAAHDLASQRAANDDATSGSGWYHGQLSSRGTVSDRIATAALRLARPDGVLYLSGIDTLFDIAKKDNHHYEAALKALCAVWPKLLPQRALRRFTAQHFSTLPIVAKKETGADGSISSPKQSNQATDVHQRDKVTMYWYVEDALKRMYNQFLAGAEAALKDTLQVRREAWLKAMGELLGKVVEGRHLVVALIVDKLGDPTTKIAHTAYHSLLAALSESSTSQAMVLTELEKLVFQRNCPKVAQKFCTNIMNQFVFSNTERPLALKCIGSYLSLFRLQLLEGTLEHSLTDAILVGLRRAFPFAGSDFTTLEPHMDALFTLAQTGSFQRRTQVLALILQLIVKGWKSLQDRFYRSLYSILLISPAQIPPQSVALTGFFTTLYKALTLCTEEFGGKAKSRMLATADEDGNLNLKQSIKMTLHNAANTRGTEEELSYENLLIAFSHRLLQRCLFHASAFVCTSLMLIGELLRLSPALRKLLKQGVAREGQQPAKNTAKKEVAQKRTKKSRKESEAQQQQQSNDDDYKPGERNPFFAHAQKECLWILRLLSRHTHPSVAKLATVVILGIDTVYDLQPLDEISLAKFLDMFANVDGHATSSEKQVLAGQDHAGGGGDGGNQRTGGSMTVFKRAVRAQACPNVTDPAFIALQPQQVDVAHIFMHRFARQRERFRNQDNQSVWQSIQSSEVIEHTQHVQKAAAGQTLSLFGPEMTEAQTATEGKERLSSKLRLAKNVNGKTAPKEQNDDDEPNAVELEWGGMDDDVELNDDEYDDDGALSDVSDQGGKFEDLLEEGGRRSSGRRNSGGRGGFNSNGKKKRNRFA